MTKEELISQLDRRIEYLKSGIPMQRAVRSIMAEMAVRIFEEGKNSSGGPIGTYNTSDELYVNPATLPKNVAPRGKPGKERNVEDRKTVYFKSYAALRSEQGRESGKINLRLTNDLQSDWSNASLSGDEVAKNPEPTKVSNIEYRIVLNREVNIQKRNGLEERFGPIFNLTASEHALYFAILEKEIRLNA